MSDQGSSSFMSSPRFSRNVYKGDFCEEKDLIVGELTARIKGLPIKHQRNRTDGAESDENDEYKDDGNCFTHTPNSSCVSLKNPRNRSQSPLRSLRGSQFRGSVKPVSRASSSNPRLGTRPLNPPLSSEIANRIGNRATKTFSSSVGKCGFCKKDISLDGCTAFGKVFHKECFKCSVCHKRIEGKFFEKNGKIYCGKDYKNVGEICCVCKIMIKGDSVVSGVKHYHPSCMTCHICGDVLKGSYLSFEGQPICERDYKNVAEKCTVCQECISGKYYSLDGKTYCEADYIKQCQNCPRCLKPTVGKSIRIEGASFHPLCFTCVTCGKDMSHTPFIPDEQFNIYCTEDYHKKFAYKCFHCKMPIVPKKGESSASRIRALEKDFHPKCFKCEDCGLVLDSKVKGKECYPFKGHVLCIKCNRKKVSSDEESSENDDVINN